MLISIVIPCYNESKRFHYLEEGLHEFFEKASFNYEIIVVNDGSTDDTEQKLAGLADKYQKIKLVSMSKNEGKFSALREGAFMASGDFICTCDADMSTNPLVLEKWLSLSNQDIKENIVCIGDRQHADSIVEKKIERKILGILFNKFCNLIIGLGIEDTQNGFKLYPKNMVKQVFPKVKNLGWAHDVEILARAHKLGFTIVNLPVVWVHRDGSNIKLLRDGIKMAFEVLSIAINLKREKL